jgi:hypothetical protein
MECGDALGRPMIYPPLLYWAMSWLRLFSFGSAEKVWSFALVASVLLGTGLAVFHDRKKLSRRDTVFLFGLWVITFFLLPMRYALERGNVDALVVFVYGFGIYLFARGRPVGAGVAFAAAAWLKVYPVIPALVLFGGIFFDAENRRRYFKPIALGYLLGGVGFALLLWPDSYRYLVEVLPRFSRERGGFLPHTHILYKSIWSWIFLKIPILVLWVRMTARALEKDPVLTLTGGLAISTFFQNVSNDYNLITAYPFLFIVLKRLLHPKASGYELAILVLGFVAFVGDRSIWMPLFGNRGVLYWQILWLIVFPLYVVKRIDKGNWPDGNLSVR